MLGARVLLQMWSQGGVVVGAMAMVVVEVVVVGWGVGWGCCYYYSTLKMERNDLPEAGSTVACSVWHLPHVHWAGFLMRGLA